MLDAFFERDRRVAAPYRDEQRTLVARVGARRLVLAALCAAALIAYLHRQAFAVAESTIREELNLSREAMGAAMAAFQWGYSLFQLPGGAIAQRFGTRLTLPILSVGWSLAAASAALAGSAGAIVSSRLIMGGFQAGLFPSCVATFRRWFPPRERATPNGVLSAFMSVGGVIAATMTGELLNAMSWRAVFAIYALPGLLWAIAFYLWFRDAPRDHPWVDGNELATIDQGQPDENITPDAAAPTPWSAILASPTMWLINIQQFGRAAGYVFYQTWFPTYLQESRGLDVASSGYATSLPLLATVLGAIAGGWLSDWLQLRTGRKRVSRCLLAAMSTFFCAGLILTATRARGSVELVALLSAGAFCVALAGAAAYTVTIDVGGRDVARVFSVMNLSGNVGATLLPLAVPALIRVAGWDSVLFVLVGAYVAAAASWLLINPDRAIHASR